MSLTFLFTTHIFFASQNAGKSLSSKPTCKVAPILYLVPRIVTHLALKQKVDSLSKRFMLFYTQIGLVIIYYIHLPIGAAIPYTLYNSMLIYTSNLLINRSLQINVRDFIPKKVLVIYITHKSILSCKECDNDTFQ